MPAVWPEVLAVLKQVNISDYTIFHKDNVLFGAADYTAMNATPIIKQWYTVCEPCQQPLEARRPGEWWAEMDTVFQMD